MPSCKQPSLFSKTSSDTYTPPSLQRPKKSQNNFLALFMKAKSSPGFNGFSCSTNTPESGVGIPIIASCSKLHRDRCEICENGDKSLRNRHERRVKNNTCSWHAFILTATESFKDYSTPK